MGEHTRALLASIGYDATEIDTLLAQRAVR
jgi:hypothetical protein